MHLHLCTLEPCFIGFGGPKISPVLLCSPLGQIPNMVLLYIRQTHVTASSTVFWCHFWLAWKHPYPTPLHSQTSELCHQSSQSGHPALILLYIGVWGVQPRPPGIKSFNPCFGWIRYSLTPQSLRAAWPSCRPQLNSTLSEFPLHLETKSKWAVQQV